jgi:hypothetical protein
MASTPLPPDGPDRSDAREADRPLHEEIDFERSDIATYKIVLVLFGIALVFVGAGFLCLLVLRLNVTSDERGMPAQYNVSKEPLPVAPRLEPLDRRQATATTDVFAKQLAMEQTLHSYGNTNDTAFVHIPIQQAIKLVAPTLESRQGDQQLPAKGFGLVGGGESNSGRLYSEAPKWLRENK